MRISNYRLEHFLFNHSNSLLLSLYLFQQSITTHFLSTDLTNVQLTDLHAQHGLEVHGGVQSPRQLQEYRH